MVKHYPSVMAGCNRNMNLWNIALLLPLIQALYQLFFYLISLHALSFIRLCSSFNLFSYYLFLHTYYVKHRFIHSFHNHTFYLKWESIVLFVYLRLNADCCELHFSLANFRVVHSLYNMNFSYFLCFRSLYNFLKNSAWEQMLVTFETCHLRS